MAVAIDFPFVRCVAHNFEDERGGEKAFISWRPGVDYQMFMNCYNDPDGQFIANGMGKVLLTEISRHDLPKPYHTRVFYIRQWQDPDGRVFGKKQIRIVTAGRFTNLCSGWQHEFEIEPDAVPDDVVAFEKEGRV